VIFLKDTSKPIRYKTIQKNRKLGDFPDDEKELKIEEIK